MDEVSTYTGAVALDRRSRPGLSVTLESEWVGPAVFPGSAATTHDLERPSGANAGTHGSTLPRVKITTWPLKIGKTLAFLNVELSCANTGVLLVRARHVKYLPMGPMFDTLFMPGISALSLPVLEQVWGAGEVRQDQPSSLAGIFPWERDGDGGVQHQLEDGGVSCEFAVSVIHGNPIGGLHGGAACLLSERVAAAGLTCSGAGASSDATPPFARKMVATLSSHVNAAAGDQVLLRSVVNHSHSSTRGESTGWVSTEATLSRSGAQEPAVTTEIMWR